MKRRAFRERARRRWIEGSQQRILMHVYMFCDGDEEMSAERREPGEQRSCAIAQSLMRLRAGVKYG
eukprot:2460026-Pleurochrysis_carterae.AAC.1